MLEAFKLFIILVLILLFSSACILRAARNGVAIQPNQYSHTLFLEEVGAPSNL